ncbi:DUF4167 domain-containing protein [Phenylobacterium terrae]|uniref:DUF4167 domain-containing protein n=1 Tax=Phenylobacterium terrae TaxID=2665495 RepID=A0ABW4MWH3_9CAUL
MRDFKGMKRQRGRNRGGGGGGKPQQNANRAFDSNGPDGVKVRGNAQHVFEKYQQLARDAGSAGDRVLAENYLQHAEHYFRLLRAMQPQRSASEILGRDQFTSGIDIDFEDESGAQANAEADAAQEGAEATEADGDGRERGGWQGRDRDGRDREGRDRDGRDRDGRDRDRGERDERRGDRFEGRRDRGERDDRPRDDRSRDRFEGRRDRDDRDRGDRDRGGERRERSDRPERDPLPVTEPQATPLVAAEERPSPMLRDAEGGESHAPAFLQSSVAPRAETPEAEEGAAPAKRPRRRRAPRSFEAGSEGAPPTTEAEEV